MAPIVIALWLCPLRLDSCVIGVAGVLSAHNVQSMPILCEEML